MTPRRHPDLIVGEPTQPNPAREQPPRDARRQHGQGKKTMNREERARNSRAGEPRPSRSFADKEPSSEDVESAASGDPGEEARDTSAAGTPAERMAALEKECASFRERWLRSEAELTNYRRRAARDLEEAERRSRDRILSEIVSLADDLERALDAAEQTEEAGPIYQGVRLVHERVREILRSHGVGVIDPAGKPFNPHEAEALLEVEAGDRVPGTVVDVIAKGYRQGDRLLRPAKVTVARAPEGGRAGAAGRTDRGSESGGPRRSPGS